MAERIHLLSSEVIDCIAAGEVVERPASVVKELLENSLDAGAKNIEVTLHEGGLELLKVVDDGQGMSPADARLAILRHATSKLTTAADLFCIKTLGFRGEALSSIAAVSRMLLTTRTAESGEGLRLEVVGGEIRSESWCGADVGTQIEIQDLFFNTPARRKFLRGAPTEQAQVLENVVRVLLGARRGSVIVSSDKRRLLDIPEIKTPEDEVKRISLALGYQAESFSRYARELGDVALNLFLGARELWRNDTKGLWFFVNGRYVRDRLIQKAVLEGVKESLAEQRYPTLVLYIDIPPETLDVNVHPQKTEVRFSDSQAIFKAVYSLLKKATSELVMPAFSSGLAGEEQPAELLDSSLPLKELPFKPLFAHYPGNETGDEFSPPRRSEWPRSSNPAYKLSAPPLVVEPPNLGASNQALGEIVTPRTEPLTGLHYLGTVFTRYMFCEAAEPQNFLLIDKLAAYQSLVFTELQREFTQKKEISTYLLLFPESFTPNKVLFSWLMENSEELARFGLVLDNLSKQNFIVRAIPTVLQNLSAATNESNRLLSFVQAVVADLRHLGALNRGDAQSSAFSSELAPTIFQIYSQQLQLSDVPLESSLLGELIKIFSVQDLTHIHTPKAFARTVAEADLAKFFS